MWADTAPNSEEARSHSHEEREESLTEVASEGFCDHANMFDSSTSCNLQAQFESTANKIFLLMNIEDYYEDLMRSREV